jgi:predicted phosphodiesterase
MALTRIIGDIHGEWELYHQTATDAINFGGCDRTIQVGDFGVGFSGPYWHDRADEFHWDGTHRFIRGNHDKPSKCKDMPGWIKDGRVENDVMFIGGAWSIDWQYRTEGTSWWADEELSSSELYEIHNVYATVKPRVIITHDCPLHISKAMFFDTGIIKGLNYSTRTGQAFDAMSHAHEPDFWLFGHWHHTMAYKHGKTTYVCLGIHDYIDIDLTDSDKIRKVISERFTL